jgi:hypothetical protein
MVADRFDVHMLVRAAAMVGVSTTFVTAAFIGIVALATGAVADLADRLPFYVLIMAIVFTGFVFLIDARANDGGTVIVSSIGVAILGFGMVLLAGEGLVFLITKPDQLLTSQLIIYLISAGLVCTGLAYWGLRHWREFVA